MTFLKSSTGYPSLKSPFSNLAVAFEDALILKWSFTTEFFFNGTVLKISAKLNGTPCYGCDIPV